MSRGKSYRDTVMGSEHGGDMGREGEESEDDEGEKEDSEAGVIMEEC